MILDEPTSAIDNTEIKFLFKTIKKLRESGVSIIFISHILEEVLEISDRITIFKDSESVGTFKNIDIDQQKLVNLMTGEQLAKKHVRKKRR